MIPTRPLLLALLAALAAPLEAAQPATSAGAKEEMRQLKSRIDAAQKELAAAEESKHEAVDALKNSERAISDANRTLAELSQQSRTASRELGELKAEQERHEASLRQQQDLLAQLLYRQYLAGQPEQVRLLLNKEDPNQIARQLHYFSHISRARADLIEQLRREIARVAELAAETAAKASELAAIAKQQAAQKQRLEKEKKERGQVLARISRDIDKHRRDIQSFKRDEDRLARLIEELSRIVAKPAPKPRGSPVTPQPRASVNPQLRNDRVPERSDGTAFAELRGRLALPVKGTVVNRYGTPRADGGVLWRGLMITAPAGETVRAVAGGRVVFADWLRGFGNLLIVDHGEGYMSLYGFNETLFKQVGELIRGGETIASVGNSGGGSDSGLYFELRHQGKPFDPLSWVSVR